MSWRATRATWQEFPDDARFLDSTVLSLPPYLLCSPDVGLPGGSRLCSGLDCFLTVFLVLMLCVWMLSGIDAHTCMPYAQEAREGADALELQLQFLGTTWVLDSNLGSLGAAIALTAEPSLQPSPASA